MHVTYEAMSKRSGAVGERQQEHVGTDLLLKPVSSM